MLREAWGKRALSRAQPSLASRLGQAAIAVPAGIARDLKYASRTLRKTPGFAAAAVAILALGLGFTLAGVAWVDELLLRPLPVERPNELVQIGSVNSAGQVEGIRSQVLETLRAESMFAGVCGIAFNSGPTEVDGLVRTVDALTMSGGCFQTLGLRTQLGRAFAPSDDAAAAPKVAWLTDSFWRTAFAASPEVIGQTIRFGGGAYTVAGVMDPRFTGVSPGFPPGLVMPLEQTPLDFTQPPPGRVYYWVFVLARRAPGVSAEQARARIGLLRRRLLEESVALRASPAERGEYLARQVMVAPLGASVDTFLRRRFGRQLYGFAAICGIVLLIACANLATLLLARGAARQKEVAVRIALGASRFAVSRWLAMEAVLLTLAGGLAGIAIASEANRIVAARAAGALAMSLPAALDGRAALFLIALTAAVAAVLGALPAWQCGRLYRGVRASARAGSQKILLGAQIALTLALVSAAGLLAVSHVHLRNLDRGIEVARVSLGMLRPLPGVSVRSMSASYHRDLVDRVSELPGVIAAGLSSFTPFWNAVTAIPVSMVEDPAGPLDAQVVAVTDRMFDVLGVPILAGERFRRPEANAAVRSAILSRSLAERLGGDRVIGRRLRAGNAGEVRVIGIAGNTQLSLERPEQTAPYMVWINMWESPPERQAYAALLIKHAAAPAAAPLRELVQGMGFEYVENFRTLEQAVAGAFIEDTALAFATSGFAVFALVLAATGLFGLLSYQVARRTQEIGIRMALGADRADVRRLIVRQIAAVVAMSSVAGIVLALAAGRMMSGLVHGLSAFDPRVLGAALAALVSAALLAAWIPARRAASVDPVTALRRE